MNNQYQQPHMQHNTSYGTQQPPMTTSPQELMAIEHPIVFTSQLVHIAYQKDVGLVIIHGPSLINDNLKLSLIKAYNSLPATILPHSYSINNPVEKDPVYLRDIISLLGGVVPSGQFHTAESFSYWTDKSSKYLSGHYPANLKEVALPVYKTIAMAAANHTAQKRSKAVFHQTLSKQLIDLLELKYCLDDSLLWISGAGNSMYLGRSFAGMVVHDRFPENAQYVLNKPDQYAEDGFRFEVKNIDRSSADFAVFVAMVPDSLGKPATWRLRTYLDGGLETIINESRSISHLLNIVSYIQESGSLKNLVIDSSCFVPSGPITPMPGGQKHNPQNTYSTHGPVGSIVSWSHPMPSQQLPNDCSAFELANGDSPLKWNMIDKPPQCPL